MKYSRRLEKSEKEIEACWNALVACALLLAFLLFTGNIELNLNQGLMVKSHEVLILTRKVR